MGLDKRAGVDAAQHSIHGAPNAGFLSELKRHLSRQFADHQDFELHTNQAKVAPWAPIAVHDDVPGWRRLAADGEPVAVDVDALAMRVVELERLFMHLKEEFGAVQRERKTVTEAVLAELAPHRQQVEQLRKGLEFDWKQTRSEWQHHMQELEGARQESEVTLKKVESAMSAERRLIETLCSQIRDLGTALGSQQLRLEALEVSGRERDIVIKKVQVDMASRQVQSGMTSAQDVAAKLKRVAAAVAPAAAASTTCRSHCADTLGSEPLATWRHLGSALEFKSDVKGVDAHRSHLPGDPISLGAITPPEDLMVTIGVSGGRVNHRTI